jgi:hypothetical protein
VRVAGRLWVESASPTPGRRSQFGFGGVRFGLLCFHVLAVFGHDGIDLFFGQSQFLKVITFHYPFSSLSAPTLFTRLHLIALVLLRLPDNNVGKQKSPVPPISGKEPGFQLRIRSYSVIR